MANENGIIATAKDIIPRGARIPVKTRTAANGKKTIPKGICRQSKPAINAFVFQGNAALYWCVCGETTCSVSVTTHYAVIVLGLRSGGIAPVCVHGIRWISRFINRPLRPISSESVRDRRLLRVLR
jgi:hypothetical protein